jgi:hypothetical protein
MTVTERIDEIFADCIARRGYKKKVAALVEVLDASHTDLLLDKVLRLGDPMDFANEAETSVPVQQFFAFIDLASGLVLLLGPDAVSRALAREARGSEYLPWLQKFVGDERFHAQVLEQIPAAVLKQRGLTARDR